ncbi:MAG: hypothetical protein H6579_05035 [Chitinophagales bacterium]|nr:hypothetical protein [Chitinophagales bacterium]
MKKLWFAALVLTCFYVFTIASTSGIYFEHYESILNFLISGEASGLFSTDDFYTTWVFYFPLFSFLADYFQSSQVYASAYVIFTILNLSFVFGIVIYYLFQSKRSLLVRLVLFLSALLVSFDMVYYQNNLRLAFLAYFAIFLFLNTQFDKKIDFGWIAAVSFYALLAFFIRVEIAMICAMFCTFLILLYREKLNKTVFIFLCIVLVAGIVIFGYQSLKYPELTTYMQVEKEFEDRYSVDFDVLNEKEFVWTMALRRFVLDSDNITILDYKEFLSDKSFLAYLKNPLFLESYKEKIDLLMEDLYVYRYFLLYSLFNFLLVFANERKDRRNLFKLILVAAIVVLFPFALSILVSCPYNLVISILIGLNILALIYFLKKDFVVERILQLVYLAFFVLVIGQFTSWSEHQQLETEKADKSLAIRKMMEDYTQEGKTIVFGELLPYDYYPSRLFAMNTSKRIRHYYMGMYFFAYQGFYLEKNKEFFGNNIESLASRIDHIVDSTDVVFVSTMSQNEFLEDYLSQFCRIDIGFQELYRANYAYEPKAYHVFRKSL